MCIDAFSRRSPAPARAVFLPSLFMAFMLVSTVVRAADEASISPDEATAKAKVLIENMLKEREKITSGVVFVRGNQFIGGDNQLPEHPIRGMYAFDHEHGLLRFDNSKRMLVRSLSPDKLAAAGNNLKVATALTEPEVSNAILRYVRNAEYSASWEKMTRNTRDSMYLRRVDAEMGGRIASMHHMIDVRACGVMTYFEFDSGDFERGKTVKDYCEALLEFPVAEVVEKDELIVIVFRLEHRELRLTIDTKRQFSPVDFVCKWLKSPGTTFDTSQTSHIRWTTIEGVSVPKSFSIEFDIPDAKKYVLCRFSYEWQSVNKPVDKEYFDYKRLPDIPDGSDVVEMRMKEPFQLGVWQEGKVFGPEDESEDELPDADDLVAKLPSGTEQHQPIEGARSGEERDNNCLKMKFVWCPPGKFMMGSPPDEIGRTKWEGQTEVALTKGFWLGKYEVTQAQWSKLKGSGLWKGQRQARQGDNCPATYLSWANAMAFCDKLTRLERAAGRLPEDWQYTLPTEAQWEYACRAGTATRFGFGDDESLLNEYSWNATNSTLAGERYARAVGQKKPNSIGLYDMHGNVAEWCRDGWNGTAPGGTDPCIPANNELRVVRGGNFCCPASLCRSAGRHAHDSLSRTNFAGDIGCRVALCRAK
jgi:sulfatase modifying factor 1